MQVIKLNNGIRPMATIQDGVKTGIQPLPAAQNSVAVKPCI
ncbi:hypothetical protein QG404_04065 [Arsenophonus apicola]|uniref:Uncharacterized protein n=1 Tax=Arsenophonus apicola TaxID=2879119 RepID=A0ABY8P3L1_9GAMM|nr:hypothetical protein QG404_04065 [Arsenophonus apicola]